MARLKKTTLCPLGGEGVGGKWKFWILFQLLSGTTRFRELHRRLPGVSRQMLTIQLRELEQVGLVHRRVYIEMPPKVEYSLTDLGQNLAPLIRQMELWGKWFSRQIGPQFDWVVSLGGRWKFWVWYLLLAGPKRFSEIERQLPEANRQILTTQLRELERMGIIYRQARQGEAGKIEYKLSDLGQKSAPMLRQMYGWGRWCCEQIGVKYEWPVEEDQAIGLPL